MRYNGEDFRRDTPPRIMGSETEYTSRHVSQGQSLAQHIAPISYYHEINQKDGRYLWLENGAYLYVDCGGVIEYATPEVTSPSELLVYERAGEQTVQAMVDSITDGDEQVGTIYKRSGYCDIYKDDKRIMQEMTTGHHENYTSWIETYSEAENGYYESPLQSHVELTSYLATRGVWAGAGMLTMGGYELTQKGNAINFTSVIKTTDYGDKPPYLTHLQYGIPRIEVRLGDGNMSDWAIKTKFAFTSAVLRLIEHNTFPERLLINSAYLGSAFRRTSLGQSVPTHSGNISAASHQQAIALAVLEFAEDHPNMPEEEIAAAKDILEVCCSINQIEENFDGVEEIADKVDWAAKLQFLREHHAGPLSAGNIVAVSQDLRWEDVSKKGLARSWYKKYQPPLVSEQLVQSAIIMAPATRALARVSLLSSMNKNTIYHVKWDRVIDSYGDHFLLPDPYDATPNTAYAC